MSKKKQDKTKTSEAEATEEVEAPKTDTTEKAETPTENTTEHPPIVFNLPGMGDSETKSPRTVTLYGDIDEDLCCEAVDSLLMHAAPGVKTDPVKLYISTWGGSAADMFSVYDLIKSLRETVPVHTVGLGKVMSAGVVLLACGEKGHRKIGANCRIMFHGVQAGHVGSIYNLENEMEEAKWTQERYIKALVEETNMSANYLKKLIDRKLNVYFSAEEAIELGIADEII